LSSAIRHPPSAIRHPPSVIVTRMSHRKIVRFVCAVSCACGLSGVATAQRGAAPVNLPQTSAPEPLKFRYMGPAPAGRIASVAGIPGDPTTYYLGSASGGLWKSTDGGTTFVPIFDD